MRRTLLAAAVLDALAVSAQAVARTACTAAVKTDRGITGGFVCSGQL